MKKFKKLAAETIIVIITIVVIMFIIFYEIKKMTFFLSW